MEPSNDSDGMFVFIVAQFFLFILKEKKKKFLKIEQKNSTTNKPK